MRDRVSPTLDPAARHATDEAAVMHARILVVDDDEAIRRFVGRALRELGNVVVEAEDVRSARSALESEAFDLVLTDLRLPGGSGLGFLDGLRDDVSRAPVVVMTGLTSEDVADVAFGLGAYGFLSKPFTAAELAVAVRNGLNRHGLELERDYSRRELEQAVAQGTTELRAALDRVVASEQEALAAAARARRAEEETVAVLSRAIGGRDTETGEHNERVGAYAELLARRAGWSDERAHELSLAARLHDIGKVSVPDVILYKPANLVASERALMQTHCRTGFTILHGADSSILQLAAMIALTHHERWDGRGYPRGLRGEAIPEAGRIVAVADVFDALTTDRPYRPRMTVEQACHLLGAERGGHFEPRLVDEFLDLPQARAIAVSVASQEPVAPQTS